MAEERNLSLTRVSDADDNDEDTTKAELQRRMEEARESITQTVTEIKETVANQYQQVKTTISDSLDWREQYRRRPIPFTVGALGVGLLVGYSIAGAFKSDDDEDDYDTEDALYQMDESPRPYAAQAIIGAPPPRASLSRERVESRASTDVGPETRPSYSSGYEAPSKPAVQEDEDAEPEGPGLFERFKETKAYDRLQDELSTLGSRAVEELSKTAQHVILPALLGKLKDMIGIDLSMQKKVVQRGQLEHETARTSAATDAVDDNPSPAASGSSTAYASRAGGGGNGGAS